MNDRQMTAENHARSKQAEKDAHKRSKMKKPKAWSILDAAAYEGPSMPESENVVHEETLGLLLSAWSDVAVGDEVEDTWAKCRVVMTQTAVSISKSRDHTRALHKIPLHEIFGISAGKIYLGNGMRTSISRQPSCTPTPRAPDAPCVEQAASGAVGHGEETFLFQIRTKEDGANFGRIFTLRADSAELRAEWMRELEHGQADASASWHKKMAIDRFQRRVRSVYESNVIQFVVACMIVCNFFTEAFNLQYAPVMSDKRKQQYEAADTMFTLIFLVEVLVNMTANLVQRFVNNRWSLFDLTIVLISLVSLGPTELPFVKAMRLFRVLRLLRVFGRVQALRQLMAALGAAVGPVLTAMTLVLCIVCMYSILGVNFFSEQLSGHFKTFSRGVFTMFQITTLDSWSSLARDLFPDDETLDPGVVIFFTSFICIVVFTLLPVVVAVLLDNFTTAARRLREEHDLYKLLEQRSRNINTLDPLLECLMSYESEEDLAFKLRSIFEGMDIDEGGLITYQELYEGLYKMGFQPPIRLSVEEYENLTHGKCVGQDNLDIEGFSLVMREQLHRLCQRRLGNFIENVHAESGQDAMKMFASKLLMHSLVNQTPGAEAGDQGGPTAIEGTCNQELLRRMHALERKVDATALTTASASALARIEQKLALLQGGGGVGVGTMQAAGVEDRLVGAGGPGCDAAVASLPAGGTVHETARPDSPEPDVLVVRGPGVSGTLAGSTSKANATGGVGIGAMKVEDAFELGQPAKEQSRAVKMGGGAASAAEIPDGFATIPVLGRMAKTPTWRDQLPVVEKNRDLTMNRRSHCNAPGQNAEENGGTISNEITTSKYTAVTFLPKNLQEQFERMANVYFLLISCLQVFTSLSPTSKYSTLSPFSFVLMLNMVREAWEDRARHKADQEVNGRTVEVVRPSGKMESVAWRDLVLGDLVRVRINNEFPADLVLLSSSFHGDGLAYIDTCNLDGETNLKICSSLPQTKAISTSSQAATLEGFFEFEPPNNRLYTFNGKLVCPGQPDAPVDNNNILLRGAMLRNTEWIFGQVLYVGPESKIMMNSRKGRNKSSNVEETVNYLVFGMLVVLLIVVSAATMCMSQSWNSEAIAGSWYIPYASGLSSTEEIEGWITFLLLLNNYVPISLYVSMEFAKAVQGLQINWDLEMFHAETDTAALARTTNLNEELGQIEYILTDKTGTLTQNVMEFRKCFIDGVSYGFGTTEIGMAASARGVTVGQDADTEALEAEATADPDRAQVHRDTALNFDDCRLLQHYHGGGPKARAIQDFFRVLSVSHTVIPAGDLNDPHTIVYQAESPDEAALSLFAKALGWFFCGRTSLKVSVNVHGTMEVCMHVYLCIYVRLRAHMHAYIIHRCDVRSSQCVQGIYVMIDDIHTHAHTQEFDILNVNKFNSTRKRMSVVCRTPEGKIMLYCKGADNVMIDRLAPGQQTVSKMKSALAHYGTEGLRTLVVAQRELSGPQWTAWNKVHLAALTALSDRESALELAAEQIEKDMMLVGATAVEDKLQEGVPDTIAMLGRAGIKIWVLTGDKMETAENIAFACRLLNTEMQLHRIVADGVDSVPAELKRALDINKEYIGKATEHLALIIEGKALMEIMDSEELTEDLLLLGQMCKAVVACRVSPDQKRQMVSMVRNGIKPDWRRWQEQQHRNLAEYRPMTLAIGDGANDVPMIMEAHVGVGISGNEGLQAVRSADYAIAQFRYLQRLLLVHGRNNYIRVARLVIYVFYKNTVCVTALFLYNIYSGWSGTTIFPSFLLMCYNVFFTGVPVIVYGFMEQDVSPDSALMFPQLYIPGQRKACFNFEVACSWGLNALVHTLIVFLIPIGALGEAATEDIYVAGSIIMMALVVGINMRLVLMENHISYISHLAVGCSILLVLLVMLLMSSALTPWGNPATTFDIHLYYGVCVCVCVCMQYASMHECVQVCTDRYINNVVCVCVCVRVRGCVCTRCVCARQGSRRLTATFFGTHPFSLWCRWGWWT